MAPVLEDEPPALADQLLPREQADSPEGRVREAVAVHAIVDLLVEWMAAKWKRGGFAGWPSFRLPKR